MSGATFILAINLAVTALLATAFMAIAAYDRSRDAPRWVAGAYLSGVAYYAIEFLIRFLGYGNLAVTLGAAVLLCGLAALNVGIARHYRVAPARLLSLAVVVGGTLATLLVGDLPRYSLQRMLAFQAPYALMQAIAAWTVCRAPRKRLPDVILLTLFAASGAQFFSKPFIAHAVGGWGASASDYLGSNYAMISQTLSTIFALGIALSVMVVIVRDLLDEAMARSHTDTLTGLLNRRGFGIDAQASIDHAAGLGLPISAVICDLDHFKLVNDRFGHASGDRVLVAFADFLKLSLTERYVAARIGGEEFAILLPGANASAARLFAEGARTVFAAQAIPGVADQQCTASFGVAQLMRDETLDALMARADAALYEAKRGGRDRVCVSRAQPSSDQVRAVRSA